jgi:hypothetical protein
LRVREAPRNLSNSIFSIVGPGRINGLMTDIPGMAGMSGNRPFMGSIIV